MRTRVPVALTLAAAGAFALACQRGDDLLPPGTELSVGTWGGEGAGLIVQVDGAHAHIGCTFGNFAAPVALDEEGRFTVQGSYVLRAFPIVLGPELPATFSGVVRGDRLTLGVVVNDTVDDRTVTLGPVTLTLGSEPRMGPCPICADPPSGAPAAGY